MNKPLIMSKIIDLAKYPIDKLESKQGHDLIDFIKQQLKQDGSCVLPDFVTKEALQLMVEQAETLSALAYPGPTAVTPYYFNYKIGENLEVDENHPVKRKGKRHLSQIASDLIPSHHLLSELFHSPLMTKFLGVVLNKKVYQNSDRYQSLNINMQDQGGCQQWHFDTAHMVTTLLLQAPHAGGVFEYSPNIRSETSENFEEVRKVMDGNADSIKQLHLESGMLSLFQGHYSIHRVTAVQGNTKRIQAILGYTTQPDLKGNLESSILHYGPRVAETESANALYP